GGRSWGAVERRDGGRVGGAKDAVGGPEAVARPAGADRWQGAGTGLGAGGGALSAHLGPRLASVDATALPRAAAVARLAAAAFERGEALPPERIEPAYLRDNVALTQAEQQALRDAR